MRLNVAKRFQDETIRMHYEIEFKRLESMYLRLKQISEIKKYILIEKKLVSQKQLEALEKRMNESTTSTLKRLFEAGYGQELKRRGYLKNSKE